MPRLLVCGLRFGVWSCAAALLVLSGCKAGTRSTAPASHPTVSTRAEIDLPGQRGAGAVKLPNQWWLRPVGRQILLGDFPANMAVHPDGKYVAVLHCGHGQNEVVIVDIAATNIVSRASVEEAFYGIAFSKDGGKIFCSGAGDEVVHSFTFRKGY